MYIHVHCGLLQLSYSDDGLAVTMRRDVRNNRMATGAVQMGADISLGGNYTVREDTPRYHSLGLYI